jgi:peroxin-5
MSVKKQACGRSLRVSKELRLLELLVWASWSVDYHTCLKNNELTSAYLQSLAISYTNESFERASYAMLLRWLRERFPEHHIPDETTNAVRNQSAWSAHARITEVFLNLARTQHSQGILDPEVQIGLGVLFYTNSEFDRAKDCFESALSARPKVSVDWRKLS